jgi:rare lipoprotein A
MRIYKLLIPIAVMTAGCAASTYPLNPQLAAQAGLSEAPSFLERPDGDKGAAFLQRGNCSWYGPGFHGRRTSNGERFDKYALTAAHPTLPFGSLVEVTDVHSGKKVRVRINDRGPFVHSRILDLSYAAAASLDIVGKGVASIELRLLDIDEALWPGRAWALQVASFSTRADATHFIDAMDAKQRSAGLYYIKGPDDEAKDYRVRFGPFACENSAKTAAEQLKKVGLQPDLQPEQLTRAEESTTGAPVVR